ncbi:glycosyltransferase, partial [Vibrio cholerae]|nr:glycosyltransferase [Vibrio cholerae]
MKKIKVIYVVSTLKVCGPNNQLFNIVSNLDSSSFHPMVVTLSKEGKESFINKFKSSGIDVVSINSHRLMGLPYIKRNLKSIISNLSPDVIHTQGYRSDILVRSILSSDKSLSCRQLCTVRNIPQDDYPMTYGIVLGKIMVKKHVSIMKNIDMIVGVSNAVSKNLRDSFKLNNVICINNGVDTERYKPLSFKKDKELLRDHFSFPKDKKIFISTGHLSARKSPQFLIEGFIKSSLKDSILLLVGDGELKQFLVEKYKDEKSIIFLGRSDRVSELLQLSDYYVSCSVSEGLPNSVLEALSSGLPCVLSDIQPHMQIMQYLEDKVGYLYNLGSMQSFIYALSSI